MFCADYRMGPEGKVSSKSIHQFGSATNDENSIFYNNQSKLFTERKMKKVLFSLDDIEKIYIKYNVSHTDLLT